MQRGPPWVYNAGEMPRGLEDLQDLLRVLEQQREWSECFLVEVKAFPDLEDVLLLHRKREFAARQLPRPFRAVLVVSFAHARAVETARHPGLDCRGGSPRSSAAGLTGGVDRQDSQPKEVP